MSEEMLREAAKTERAEWGDPDTRRVFPTASAVHLALADLLDEAASGYLVERGYASDYLVSIARVIVGRS